MIEQHIKKLIRHTGSIAIDEYMSVVVPYYYANNHVFGSQGDFITAPEVSQMFGEIIGVWCADQFIKAGKHKFRLVELGPGRGTLMSDLLRATKHVPLFHEHLQEIILIDSSPELRKTQQATLKNYPQCQFRDRLGELGNKFTIVIANEFFDALPIKQFRAQSGKLQEVVIADDNDQLGFCLSTQSLPLKGPLPEGAIIEVCPAAETYALQIADLISSAGGAALIIDYGYTVPSYVSTLQALKSHKYHDVLQDIGTADVTAHVDFAALAQMFVKLKCSTQIQTQGDFLQEFGIKARAEKLIERGASEAKINSELNRLTSITEMGELFKVLSVRNAVFAGSASDEAI